MVRLGSDESSPYGWYEVNPNDYSWVGTTPMFGPDVTFGTNWEKVKPLVKEQIEAREYFKLLLNQANSTIQHSKEKHYYLLQMWTEKYRAGIVELIQLVNEYEKVQS